MSTVCITVTTFTAVL